MARPRWRVILVLAPDSSMNTRRAGSRRGSSSSHCSRRSRTSSRSCSLAWSVFFIAVAQSIQCPLHRHDRAVYFACGPKLFERGIRTVLNQPIQGRQPVLAEQGEAMAAGPGCRFSRCDKPRQPALKRPDVHAVRLRNPSLGAPALLIGLDRAPANVFRCYAHAKNIADALRHLNSYLL